MVHSALVNSEEVNLQPSISQRPLHPIPSRSLWYRVYALGTALGLLFLLAGSWVLLLAHWSIRFTIDRFIRIIRQWWLRSSPIDDPLSTSDL